MKTVLPYLRIARFDHWFKNVFMLPGVVVAIFADPALLGGGLTAALFKLHGAATPDDVGLVWRLMLALIATGLITSSNYVINEILDAPHDALHPVKKHRPVPSKQVDVRIGYVQWLVLAAAGLILAWPLGTAFLACVLLLWIMGCLYNIPPVRTKDKPYLDVLSESVNNALRLLLGWYATGSSVVPSISLVMAFWMIGAFFMAVKRLAEYRRIGDPVVAASYRKSFAWYDEERLLISIVYYAAAFGLFFGIFIIRYHIELILSVPFIAGLVAIYIHLGYKEDSPVQYPERLYKQKLLVTYALSCGVLMLGLMFVEIPWLGNLFSPTLTLQR
jgi:4-hydroxybenzoate polyprenyltransferase